MVVDEKNLKINFNLFLYLLEVLDLVWYYSLSDLEFLF